MYREMLSFYTYIRYTQPFLIKVSAEKDFASIRSNIGGPNRCAQNNSIVRMT